MSGAPEGLTSSDSGLKRPRDGTTAFKFLKNTKKKTNKKNSSCKILELIFRNSFFIFNSSKMCSRAMEVVEETFRQLLQMIWGQFHQ